jgi:hypothetical protein
MEVVPVSWFGRIALAAYALLAVALTAVVAVLAAGSGPRSGSGEGADAALEAPPSVYAYLNVAHSADGSSTDTRLVLMDGAEFIGAEDVDLAAEPAFTADGAFVFSHLTLTDEILALSVSTGESLTVACEGCGDHFAKCNCEAVVPFGGSEIAWLDAENRLMRADLAADEPVAEPTETVLPDSEDPVFQPFLLAGTDGLAVAAYPLESFDAAAPIFLVPLEGEPRRIDDVRPDSVDEAAFSPDGASVALTGDAETACASVTVVDVASGTARTSPLHSEEGATCESLDALVMDLWWDPDGALNTYAELGDDLGGGFWQRRLEGEAWTDVAGRSHTFDSGAVVTVSSPERYTTWGVLNFEWDGASERIDDDVEAVTVAPEGAAALR